ncbi:MAG: anion permease [Acidaminococcales bacterium]|jgi:anion transporter|nr:anion permease [Acidaminococcales bacterium]
MSNNVAANPAPGGTQPVPAARRNIGLVLGLAAFAALWFLPVPGLSQNGSRAMAVAALTAIWWIAAVMPPAFPAVLACVLYFVLKISPPADAFSGFASPSIWMLLFALIMAKGVDKSGLSKRIAAMLMKKMPLSFEGMVIVFIAMCFIFPFFIPAAPAIVALIMTLVLGFMDALGIERSPANKVSAGLTCFIAILVLTFGRVPMTGAMPNLVVVGLVRELTGVEVTWIGWLVCMWVAAPISGIVTYYYITRKYKPDVAIDPQTMRVQIKKTVESLGPVSTPEKKTLVLVLAAILLWAFDFYLKIGTNQIGIIIGILYLMPYTGVLTMADFKTLPFDIFVFAGGSYSMGVVLSKTGFAQWAASGITAFPFLQGSSFLVAGTFVLLFAVALHFILETWGVASLMTPIIVKAGILPPKAVTMLLPYGAGFYIFPYQATPIILSLGFGTTSWNDITKYGIIMTLVGIAQGILFLGTYWAWTML